MRPVAQRMGRYTPNADKRKASLSRVIRCLLLQSDRRRQLAHGQGPQRTRIKAVLFYQNPRGQRFGGVVRQNRNAGLLHNRAYMDRHSIDSVINPSLH